MNITKKFITKTITLLTISGMLISATPAHAGFFDWFDKTPLSIQAQALKADYKVSADEIKKVESVKEVKVEEKKTEEKPVIFRAIDSLFSSKKEDVEKEIPAVKPVEISPKPVFESSSVPEKATENSSPSKFVAKPETKYSYFKNEIRYKDYGRNVENLQRVLSAMGYYVGHVDGVYDRSTVDALKAFQKFEKPTQSFTTGRVVGKKTISKLNFFVEQLNGVSLGGGGSCLPGDDPWIEIIQPNEVVFYDINDSLDIQWDTCNISPNEDITLFLMNYDAEGGVAGTNLMSPGPVLTTQNDGQEIIDIPSSWVQYRGTGQYYKISATAPGFIDYISTPGLRDFSDELFAILDYSSNQNNPQCDDTIDNDGDGYNDFPYDPNCSSHSDLNENPFMTSVVYQCNASDPVGNAQDLAYLLETFGISEYVQDQFIAAVLWGHIPTALQIEPVSLSQSQYDAIVALLISMGCGQETIEDISIVLSWPITQGVVVTVDASSPISDVLLDGGQDGPVELAVFKVSSDHNEPLDLDEFKFTDIDDDNSIDTYYVQAKDMLGNNLGPEISMFGTYEMTAFWNNGSVTIPENGSILVSVKALTADVQASPAYNNGRVTLSVESPGDVETTGLVSGQAHDSVNSNVEAQGFYLFESYPEFEWVTVSNTTLTNNANHLVGKLKITANGNEDVTFQNSDGNRIRYQASMVQADDTAGVSDPIFTVKDDNGVTLDSSLAATSGTSELTIDFSGSDLVIPAGTSEIIYFYLNTADLEDDNDSIQLYLDSGTMADLDFGSDGENFTNQVAHILWRSDHMPDNYAQLHINPS